MENNYSQKWKKRGDRTGMIRNALLKSMGYTDADIEKPIVGINKYMGGNKSRSCSFQAVIRSCKTRSVGGGRISA